MALVARATAHDASRAAAHGGSRASVRPASRSEEKRSTRVSRAVASTSLSWAEGLVWIAKTNFGWIVGTLAGGILLGVAPATVAAYDSCRKRLRGDDEPFAAMFARAYRAEFWRANALLLPVVVVVLLAAGSMRLTTMASPLAWLVVVPVAAVSAAALALLVPLYVHYDLPLRRYPVAASRFVLANPGPALLMLLTLAGVAIATALLPGLLPFLSIGAWIHVSTALSLSFFASNDNRVAARDSIAAAGIAPSKPAKQSD